MENLIKKTIESIICGEISINEATDILLNEMGRGSTTIVVDEHYYNLGQLLREKNYSVHFVEPYENDTNIKKEIKSKIFITHNVRHFKDIKDMTRYHYGLISITSTEPDEMLVKKVMKVLMSGVFKKNLIQVVSIDQPSK